MKRFLIASTDAPITADPPIVILARSAEEAMGIYRKRVVAHEEWFRRDVLDLAVNCSFAERFHLESEQEQKRFIEGGIVGTEIEIVLSRVRRFFDDRPDLGRTYIAYMETEDQSLITQEFLEFVASKVEENHIGKTAFDVDAFPVLQVDGEGG